MPHHLIDILDPSQAYSAARFVADAQRLVVEISGRGRLPLLVGGTMLYFKALRSGLDTLPGADAGVRDQIEREAQTQGWPALHAQLALVDPVAAARLAPADAQRVQRALEVYRLSGRPISNWQRESARARLPLRVLKLVLAPAERSVLHARVAQRFDTMLASGFLDEVRALRARRSGAQGLRPAAGC